MIEAKRRAFSLVEIVLALGIISFGCVAIFGLLSVTATVNRRSSDETAIATMSRQVISSIKQQEFSTVQASLVGATTNLFFDQSGTLLPSSESALYQCAVTGLADASTTSSFSNGQTQVNLIKFRLVFTWPLDGSASNTNTLLTSVAR